MRAHSLVVLWAAAACACMPRAAVTGPAGSRSADPESRSVDLLEGDHPPLLGPGELMRAMEESPVSYTLASLEALDPPALERHARELWPPESAELPFPTVRAAGGDRRLEPYPANPAADRLIAEAEPHARGGRHAEASALYQRALQLQLDYYPALLGLGDAALLAGDAEGALRRFENAIQVNPLDHRAHYLRGNALLELGQAAPALDAYATALALRPRDAQVLDGVAAREKKLGIHLVRTFVLPRGLARPAGRGIQVAFDASRPHWVAWAACKALWMGEAQHREEMTGSAEHRFTTVEELECLGALLQAYLRQRAGEDIDEEPELERLGRIAAEGYLPELIVYELGGRKNPHALLLAGGDQRRKVERFIRQYVLEKEGPGVGPTYEVRR